MLTLPDAVVAALVPCATLFTNPTWRKAQLLLVGAILAMGQRTVAAFAKYDGATRIVELTSQTAVWYRSGRPAVTMRWVLVRDPQGAFGPQALLCTDPTADPTQVMEWFVLRWQLEVTPYQVRGRLFQEVRTHLGMETQREWSDLTIARTTPILLGLFSGPPWPPTSCNKSIPSPSVPQHGTTNRRKLSWMPPPWCDATCGWRPRVYHCQTATLTYGNSLPICTTEWWILSLTLLEMRTVQPRLALVTAVAKRRGWPCKDGRGLRRSRQTPGRRSGRRQYEHTTGAHRRVGWSQPRQARPDGTRKRLDRYDVGPPFHRRAGTVGRLTVNEPMWIPATPWRGPT